MFLQSFYNFMSPSVSVCPFAAITVNKDLC